jgi:hypothetical protein
MKSVLAFVVLLASTGKSPRARVPDRRHGTQGGTCSIIPGGDIGTMHQSLEIGLPVHR